MNEEKNIKYTLQSQKQIAREKYKSIINAYEDIVIRSNNTRGTIQVNGNTGKYGITMLQGSKHNKMVIQWVYGNTRYKKTKCKSINDAVIEYAQSDKHDNTLQQTSARENLYTNINKVVHLS